MKIERTRDDLTTKCSQQWVQCQVTFPDPSNREPSNSIHPPPLLYLEKWGCHWKAEGLTTKCSRHEHSRAVCLYLNGLQSYWRSLEKQGANTISGLSSETKQRRLGISDQTHLRNSSTLNSASLIRSLSVPRLTFFPL